MKTRAIKASEIESNWIVFDAAGQTLGRLATQVAVLLMGKHKPIFSPHLDTGDHVVILNADKVRFTGKKLEQRIFYRHSGYPGGLRSETLGTMLQRKPTWVVEHAVRGMLPRTRLGEHMMSKLRVYVGPDHPHQGQINAGAGAAKRPERPRRPAPAPPAESVASDESEPMAT